jgi:hypothetical protein
MLTYPLPQNINNEFLLDFPEQVKKSDPSFAPKSATLRSMFVAYEQGVLIAADYSQLELRMLAQLSGDRKLRDQVLQSYYTVIHVLLSCPTCAHEMPIGYFYCQVAGFRYKFQQIRRFEQSPSPQLKAGGDVFSAIAAGWKQADVADITHQQRQQAKQVGGLLLRF